MRVPIAVTNARAKKQNHMIQQRAIAIWRIAQLFQILGKQRDVIALNFRAFLHLFRVALMVGERMVRLGHTEHMVLGFSRMPAA